MPIQEQDMQAVEPYRFHRMNFGDTVSAIC